VHPTKRYRPEGGLPVAASAAVAADEEEGDEEPIRRPRHPVIRNLPETVAAACKAQNETMTAILKELATQTALLKKISRYSFETYEAVVDIHEALAIVTKEAAPIVHHPTAPTQLNVSKDAVEPTVAVEVVELSGTLPLLDK
jgi:hypothetical protein